MAILLLDSTIIIDHLNGRFGRSDVIANLVFAQGHTLACCSVNFTEVYSGIRPGEEQKTVMFMESLEYLPVTAEIAIQAGLLRRDWQKKGHTLSYTDVTIAAVAIGYGIPLLTDNAKHFPMPELHLLPIPERTR